MFNVRYQLRNPTGLVVPKGPSFSGAKTIFTSIDGTNICFRTPKHRPQRKSHKPIFPQASYNLDNIRFRVHCDERINVPYDWEEFELFNHAWIFNGPWFTGIRGNLQMRVFLDRPINYKRQDFSLFHPRAFEQRVGDFLTYIFSGNYSEIQHKCYSIGPVDWQQYKRLPIVAARFKVVSEPSIVTMAPDYFLIFPIADQLMISILFTPAQYFNGTQEERDEHISSDSMLELMEEIIASLEVKLSPEAEAQQQAALAGLDDISLVKHYPPLDWNSGEFRVETPKAIEEPVEND